MQRQPVKTVNHSFTDQSTGADLYPQLWWGPTWAVLGKGVAHVEEQNTDKAIMVWQDEKNFKVGRTKVAVQINSMVHSEHMEEQWTHGRTEEI